MATDEERNKQALVHVKAAADGLEVSVGSGVPDLLTRILPSRFRARRTVDQTIVDGIVAKLRDSGQFDEADVDFANTFLSDHAAKYIRLKRLEQRAQRVIDELRSVPSQLAAHAESAPANPDPVPNTSDDWVNKFREDGSLVDDEVVREVYARVLAEEAAHPGAFSLRTLGVLRYLDHTTAMAFARVQLVVIDGYLVPAQSPEDDHVLAKCGLTHPTMVALEDAGLVASSAQSRNTREGDHHIFVLRGHQRALAVGRPDKARWKVALPVHLLTPAGRQLARIAQCQPDPLAFDALLGWFRKHVPGAEFAVADLPARDWVGQASSLTWTSLN